MELTFKALYDKDVQWYGVFNDIDLVASDTPQLFNPNTTIQDIKEQRFVSIEEAEACLQGFELITVKITHI